MAEHLRAARLRAREALVRAGTVDFKPVSSAKWVNIFRTWSGVLHVQIEHDSIKGVTPQMMRWWFEHLGQSTTWDGKALGGPEVSLYHLWHHRDHVAIIPVNSPSDKANTGFIQGGQSEVHEQFNDFKDRVDVRSTTDTLSDSELNFSVRLFGIVVTQILHHWKPTTDGLAFYAETVVGCDVPIIGLFINWILMPLIYTKASGERWIRHNIEETGRTEDILPTLYKLHGPGSDNKL